MKILIATPLYPPESGGPATYSKLLEDGLPTRGIQVSLVKFGDVKHLPSGARHMVYFFRVLKAVHDCDVIYALDAVSVGFPAMFAATFARKPFIVKIVGDYAWEQGRQTGITMGLDEFVKTKPTQLRLRAFHEIQTFVARRATKIIVPSRYLKDVVKAWRIGEGKIVVIHNAIRAEAAGDLPASIVELKKQKLVVSIGRLVPWKGFSELIEAVAMLRKKGISVSLAIVGDGPNRASLEKKAREMLRVDFILTGALPHDQAYGVMLSADVFVLDSLYEGMSHTLVEAFVAGVPVVVSDVGGNTEIVTNEDNGLVVAPENPRALADALARVLTDDALRARLAARAKGSATDFSVETMLTNVARFLQTI